MSEDVLIHGGAGGDASIAGDGVGPEIPGGTTLITGGAGFIGANLAHRLLEGGGQVVLLDTLARPDVRQNVQWLREQHGRRVELVEKDVRDAAAVREVVARADRVFHFAAQVAVTTSLVDPIEDFEINARGTLHVLEAIRAQSREIPLFFASTSEVYGALPDVDLVQRGRRWVPDGEVAEHGISEEHTLEPRSPYGCSKGAADQYVIDWARSYGLANVVLRMSWIYGPRQLGTEDQGGVAHVLVRTLRGEPIMIHGDGMQVRDVLFVDDLVDALLAANERIAATRGQAFNVGGGPKNAVSLVELLDVIHEITGRRAETTHAAARTGEPRWYVSDPRGLGRTVGWGPRTPVRKGVERLAAWLESTNEPRRKALGAVA